MVYLALVYGAKGISYYPYGTFYDASSSDPVYWNWNTGLLRREPNVEDPEYYHYSNYATFVLSTGSRSIFTGYKEKWNEAKNLNAKLKAFGATLVSLTWQNAASIHKSQIGNLSQVIKYLYTLKTGGQQDTYPSSTYAEAGHMKDRRSWDYLMVVNRRCAPTQGSIDDRRKMKIQLNKGTGTWAVSQVPSGEYWTLSYNGWFTTSLFEPGEGRLYRVAPSVIYVPQNFATIHEALEVAMGGQTVQVAAGIYYENDNLTVKAGVTFQLSAGVTLQMANSKKLTVNGSISANGTSSQKITFQSISGTWYGIEVNYGGYTPFNYCIIKNATCGIRAYQTSNLYVENCEITNNTNGITFDNQSSGYVRYSKINSNSGNSGINCSQNSNPIIRSYNQIKYNAPAGLYGDYNSLPELGNWGQYGNNSISNSYDDVWSENSNSVYAQYNYWGSSSPDPNVSDNVVWQPYLTSDPTGGGLLKPLADDAPFVLNNAATDTTGKSEFAKAYLVYLSGDYTGAMVLFKELVTKYPETAAGLQALALTDYCYQNLANAIASLSYLDQVGASYAGKEISGLAQSIAVGHLVKMGSCQEAITNSRQILNAFPDKDLAKYALYDLGTIYWFFLADHKMGESYYRQLIAKYPDDDLSISALATLGEWQPGSQPKPEAPPLLTNEHQVPTEFRLEQNYPNPFNPETVISYQLPAASAVTLLICNLLGQKIRTLVDEQQAAGSYSVQWDGKDESGLAAASGIYMYSIKAGAFSAVKKMVLVR
jgi:tetratricopeptide (TPR) repeat protein